MITPADGPPPATLSRRTLLTAPALLVLTALGQVALTRAGPLTPWKGGGFGLFSTVDKLENRILLAWIETPDGDELAVLAKGSVSRLAFNGVHVISPKFLAKITETGVFPILKPYLRLAAAGERIDSFRMDKWFWTDIGDFDRLEKARRWAGS